jgi:hypothetical protein
MVLLLSITNSCLKQDVNKAEPQLSERLTQFMGVGDQGPGISRETRNVLTQINFPSFPILCLYGNFRLKLVQLLAGQACPRQIPNA